MEQDKRKEICDKIFALTKKKKSFLEICKALNLKDYELAGLITIMHDEGYNIEFVNGEIIMLKAPQQNQDVYKINKALSNFIALHKIIQRSLKCEKMSIITMPDENRTNLV